MVMNSPACKLSAATAFFLVVEALRSQPPLLGGDGSRSGRPQDHEFGDKKAELANAEAGHLPSLDYFKRSWLAMMHPVEKVPVVPGVELVVGVFTTNEEAPYHKVIRQTWMTQQGVCNALQGPQEGCGVYVSFVRCTDEGELDDGLLWNDTISLPCWENLEKGKTLNYFRFALMQYPWATHLGKMDTDVFPFWLPIVHSLSHIPRGCESYLGRPWICVVPAALCPPKGCGAPLANGQFRKRNTSSSCWYYMQGGLYIISRGLVKKATEPSGHWEQNPAGPEDVVTGQAIVHAANKHDLCVHTWPKELTQLNATHFHFIDAKGPCHTAQWAAYYHHCPAAARGNRVLKPSGTR